MFACKPFNNRQVCVKEVVNGFEISVAFDDSSNPLAENLTRGDIRVYRFSNDEEVTNLIYSESHSLQATLKNLTMVYEWCKSHN